MIEELRARAVERRSHEDYQQHLRYERCEEAEADLDRVIAIAEERHQLIHELIIEARQQIQVAEQERDQARALAKQLAEGLGEHALGTDFGVNAHPALAAYEEQSKGWT